MNELESGLSRKYMLLFKVHDLIHWIPMKLNMRAYKGSNYDITFQRTVKGKT